jgi:hypothetical protein
MLIERTFGMLKGRFRTLLKRVNIPLRHMLDLMIVCICLHNMYIINLDGFDIGFEGSKRSISKRKFNIW